MRIANRPKRIGILLLVSMLLSIEQRSAVGAELRPFQMALWVYEELGSGWIPTNTDFDVTMFSEGYSQPPGRSIMQFKSWRAENVAEYLGQIDGVDWSRVLAVVIDEPYLVDSNHSNPCRDVTNGRRLAAVETTRLIRNGAQALNAIAPKTRLWVNFSQPEVEWMMDSGCPMALNGSYIDVVSIDKYFVPFDQVRPYYDWFVNSMPQQQVALVPGTFFRVGVDNPAISASYLQGYFDYASSQNQLCNLKYGRLGITGNYDGCRVWIVAGWLAATFSDGGTTYKGELNPDSASIATVWRNQLAIPRRPQSHKLENEILNYLLRD